MTAVRQWSYAATLPSVPAMTITIRRGSSPRGLPWGGITGRLVYFEMV
jgi:hypothetical protein